jgi:hypothetical protein
LAGILPSYPSRARLSRQFQMMTPRPFDSLPAAIAGFLLLTSAVRIGCEPKLQEQQYGQIIYDVPKVKGADRPYPLPQLEDPEEKPSEDEK